MLAYIYEWIQNVAFYLVLITVLLHMLPDSDYRKYIRFFTGLVLILLLVAPVLKLCHADYWITDLYGNEEYQKQVRRIEEAAGYLGGTDGADAWTKEENRGENGKEKVNIEVEDIRIEKNEHRNGGDQD